MVVACLPRKSLFLLNPVQRCLNRDQFEKKEEKKGFGFIWFDLVWSAKRNKKRKARSWLERKRRKKRKATSLRFELDRHAQLVCAQIIVYLVFTCCLIWLSLSFSLAGRWTWLCEWASCIRLNKIWIENEREREAADTFASQISSSPCCWPVIKGKSDPLHATS